MKRTIPDVLARADWRRVEALYRQISETVNAPAGSTLPEDLVADLAAALTKTFAFYDGDEVQFMDDLFSLWADIDNLTGPEDEQFQRLYKDLRFLRFAPYAPPAGQRRRPTP